MPSIDPQHIANVSYIQFRPPCDLLTVPISLAQKREVQIVPICGSLSLLLSLVCLQSIAPNVANGCSGVPDQFSFHRFGSPDISLFGKIADGFQINRIM